MLTTENLKIKPFNDFKEGLVMQFSQGDVLKCKELQRKLPMGTSTEDENDLVIETLDHKDQITIIHANCTRSKSA